MIKKKSLNISKNVILKSIKKKKEFQHFSLNIFKKNRIIKKFNFNI